jgi:hypothetical protein
VLRSFVGKLSVRVENESGMHCLCSSFISLSTL